MSTNVCRGRWSVHGRRYRLPTTANRRPQTLVLTWRCNTTTTCLYCLPLTTYRFTSYVPAGVRIATARRFQPLIATTAIVIMNVVVDVLYAVLDPRVRLH